MKKIKFFFVLKIIGIFLIIFIAGGLYFYINSNNKNVYIADATTALSNVIHNSLASTTPAIINNTPLGGYNVLIADRGNNRLIEVNSAGQIIWQYNFNVARPGLGADDAFFVNGGSEILASLEDNQLIELIDYQTKKILWSYGTIGHAGSKLGFLNTPDDAYPFPNGDIIVADIKNCRVLEISPSKQIVHQYGQTGQCSDKNGYLNKPNGDTPLPNGNILISNITGHSLVELNSQWQRVLSMVLPIHYPSDPQMTKAGNILVSDVMNPGKIIEISPQGKTVWQYTEGLDRPSIAIELPNKNILAVDDQNQRIIVIDPQTKKILWQYGTTGVIGSGPNQLFRPDGVDIIQSTSSPSSLPSLPTYTVGEITWHPQNYLNQNISIEGYILKKGSNYAILSDEQTGTVSSHDLSIIGANLSAMNIGQQYTLEGTFATNTIIKTTSTLYALTLPKSN